MSCGTNQASMLVDNCTNKSGSALEIYWQVVNCPNAMSQVINTSPTGNPPPFEYNQMAQECVQGKVVELFNNYLSVNQITDAVTSQYYSSFQNTLLNLCIDPTLPGVCDQFLTGYCAQFSRNQVENSPILTSFCGCYTPPDQKYLTYTHNPACDPLCHRAETSQLADVTTGDILTCPENICVISGVVINATDSVVSNGINFTSLCAPCANVTNPVGPTGMSGPTGPTAGCLCIVSGTNISSTFSDIGVFEINQFCGGNSVCLVEDNAGNVIGSGGCEQFNPNNQPLPVFNEYPSIGFVVIAILTIIVILILILTVRNDRDNP